MDEDKRTVYVSNFQPDKNFQSAEKFGEVVYMSKGFIDLKNITKVRKIFERWLEEATQEDYIILTGPAVINALVIMLWFNKFGYVNILSWDTRSPRYVHNVVGLSRDGASGPNKVTVE